jgi:hypothetical protein
LFTQPVLKIPSNLTSKGMRVSFKRMNVNVLGNGNVKSNLTQTLNFKAVSYKNLYFVNLFLIHKHLDIGHTVVKTRVMILNPECRASGLV